MSRFRFAVFIALTLLLVTNCSDSDLSKIDFSEQVWNNCKSFCDMAAACIPEGEDYQADCRDACDDMDRGWVGPINVITENFACVSSEDCDEFLECISYEGDGDLEGDGDSELVDEADSEVLPEGNAPAPVIEVSKEDPEPLDVIHLDARNSTSPLGDARKPFMYWWEWAEGGKPESGEYAYLMESDGDPGNSPSIIYQWTEEAYPKLYLPVTGTYKLRMKVRDNTGQESGPTQDCADCPVWAEVEIEVKNEKQLYVELLWNRGQGVDMDVYLVRQRDNGTLGVSKAQTYVIQADPPGNMKCAEDEDCPGYFTCGGNDFCRNTCDSDQQCKMINPGWICNAANQCDINPGGYIDCGADYDCQGLGFCNPVDMGSDGWKMACTSLDGEAINDTCHFLNNNPRWGTYSEIELGCSSHAECNGESKNYFECINQQCRFECTSSNQCLSASGDYLCDPVSDECVENDAIDDPSMDIDDVGGFGPEIISAKDLPSGRYRVVVRLYADPEDVVSSGPLGRVNAHVNIYINGERILEQGFSHEFFQSGTYWKVADIDWLRNEQDHYTSSGHATPICAGWTQTKCSTSNDCKNWFGEQYECQERSWGKWCSTCPGGNLPENCNPQKPCSSDNDCNTLGDAYTCEELSGSFCICKGSGEFAEFETNPYANPFRTSLTGAFIPYDETNPRSIWCDAPEDIYKGTTTCESLYEEEEVER